MQPTAELGIRKITTSRLEAHNRLVLHCHAPVIARDVFYNDATSTAMATCHSEYSLVHSSGVLDLISEHTVPTVVSAGS